MLYAGIDIFREGWPFLRRFLGDFRGACYLSLGLLS